VAGSRPAKSKEVSPREEGTRKVLANFGRLKKRKIILLYGLETREPVKDMTIFGENGP